MNEFTAAVGAQSHIPPHAGRARRSGHPLDNPARTSLAGPHAGFAERHGTALRYPPEVSPFAALPDQPDAPAWADLRTLAGIGPAVVVTDAEPGPGWTTTARIPGVQLVGRQLGTNRLRSLADDRPSALRPADVPEMLSLVERTKPGPFAPRTIEMGAYLGIRRDGLLVAMAGERMHPPGWTEISAVCTDADFRGQGLGAALVLAVAAGIIARGETPFLHASATNVGAIRLYEALGFSLRREVTFTAVRADPGGPALTE